MTAAQLIARPLTVQPRKTSIAGLALLAIGLTVVLGSAPAAGLSASVLTPVASKESAREAYARLPLAFVPNKGQSDARVRFSAQAGGASFYFTQKEAVFSFTKGEKGTVLRLGFLGANPAPRIEGRQLGTGRVNYLLGGDPERWHTNLPTYAQIVYRDLWPGVDMVFRGGAGRLKYEFVLRPGAKVSDVRLAYRGAKALAMSRAGELLIRTPLGVLRDERPRSYQQLGGRRRPVASAFALDRRTSAYGFVVGGYDAQQPLVIDPGLIYSTYLGGGVGFGIAVDAAGSAYVFGQTVSNFPTTLGGFDTTANGQGDAFVTKLDAAGSGLVYSTYLGGSDNDEGRGIAVDAAGSAYVTGSTRSANFPTTLGAFDTTLDGSQDAFVTKLNSAGSGLVYSTYLGGSSGEMGLGIAVDAAGSAYVTGETFSANFPTTLGAFDTSLNGVDAFVTKLNAAGSAPLYSTYLGGSGGEFGFGIAVDGAGSAYVTGLTGPAPLTGPGDFPTTLGAFDTTANGGDAFVTKLNAAGSGLVYSTYLGGSSLDSGWGIAVDGAGSAYVTGETVSANFPTTLGAFDTTANGGTDAFVTKLDAAGSGLVYSTYLGGSGDDYGRGIAVDAAGSAYVTGYTRSANFPTTLGAFDTTQNGSADAFVTKLDGVGAPAVLTLSPAAATNPTGTSHTVTATVTDAAGQPVPGVVVRFTVMGAHSVSGSCTTGASGQCSFSYTGTVAGVDTITAYADSDNDSIQDPGEPTGTAEKTWILSSACPPGDDDEDDDGLEDRDERLFGTVIGSRDSDGDGLPDGNDDADGDGEDDEDEDDDTDDECPNDSDGDGEDDEDEDDEDDD